VQLAFDCPFVVRRMAGEALAEVGRIEGRTRAQQMRYLRRLRKNPGRD
jgi:hypothetical protein